MELGLIFLTGMFLSFHCVGMCGGFVALVAVAPSIATAGSSENVALQGLQFRRIFPPQLVFNAGRIASYTLLGAAAGGLGSAASLISRTGRTQAVLMIGAGILMIVSGLALAGLVHHWKTSSAASASPKPWFAAIFAKAMRLPHAFRSFPLGALMGFLPCGLIYAMLAKASSTGSAAGGALVMLAFGMGTVPALLLVAFSAGIFSISLREKLVRASGVLLAALGTITAYRGFLWLSHPALASASHTMMHRMIMWP